MKTGKEKRVMAYRRNEWKGGMRIEREGEREVLLTIGGMIVGGIYGDSGTKRGNYMDWLEILEEGMDGRDGCLVGDWNAHYHEWATTGDSMESCSRGKELWEWAGEGGWTMEPPGHPTWERERRGRIQKTTIDLAVWRGNYTWGKEEWEKLMSDHWACYGEMEVEETSEREKGIRKVVDWTAV